MSKDQIQCSMLITWQWSRCRWWGRGRTVARGQCSGRSGSERGSTSWRREWRQSWRRPRRTTCRGCACRMGRASWASTRPSHLQSNINQQVMKHFLNLTMLGSTKLVLRFERITVYTKHHIEYKLNVTTVTVPLKRREITGWPFSLWRTSRWLQNISSVLAGPALA